MVTICSILFALLRRGGQRERRTLEPAAGSGPQRSTGVFVATCVTRATHVHTRLAAVRGNHVVYPRVYTLPLCLHHTDVFQLRHQTRAPSAKETLLGACCVNTTTVEKPQMENHHRDTWQRRCAICMSMMFAFATASHFLSSSTFYDSDFWCVFLTSTCLFANFGFSFD